MHMGELVSAVSDESEQTLKVTRQVIDAFVSTITDQVRKGNDVMVADLGKFVRKDRDARKGRNPQTGEAVDIPSKRVPAFSAAKSFKEKVNTKSAARARRSA